MDEKRMEELLRAEKKLNALQDGGVDNWEWYEESLKEYHAEEELAEMKCSLVADLETAFGECAFEPSESGAGIAFNDDANKRVMQVLEDHGVTFKGIVDAEE